MVCTSMHTDYLMYMGLETMLLGLLSLELLHEMERQVSEVSSLVQPLLVCSTVQSLGPVLHCHSVS